MRNTFRLTAAAGFAALAVVACNDGGTAPLSDQAQVLAAEQDQLGAMVDTSFGTAGAALSADPAGATATTADTAPTFWGRLRVVPGGPRPVHHRDVTIQGDTARVEHDRSEEHTSELQSRQYLVCRLLLEKKKTITVSRATAQLSQLR